jgi:death-on-curing protein
MQYSSMVEYPSADKLVEFNLLALSLITAKKSDAPKVLSRAKLEQAIDFCRKFDGDFFDKAAVLLAELIRGHPFASGNRRTAFIAMKYFLVLNRQKPAIEDDPENAKVLLGIRENYYSHNEIKEWIKNGKIREFKR